MPNAKTPHSRALRAATATAANQAKLAEGWQRLNILIDPETAERLMRLRDRYKSKAVIVQVALEKLEAEADKLVGPDNPDASR